MIFDTHAHYEDRRFDDDRDDVLQSMHSRGIGRIVNVGASMHGSEESVRLAERYPFLYAAVGVHPDEAPEMTEADMNRLRELAGRDKVVAIGEIGLDYNFPDEIEPERRPQRKEQQKYRFRCQLQLAAECGLPVMIHSRDAEGDTLDVMTEYTREMRAKGTFYGGIIHCFSGSPETARQYLDMGYYLGIGGVLTFRNARRLPEVVEMTPLERLVLETDSPYLAPEPYRGRRNDSGYLPYVIAKLADIKQVSAETVIRVTEENACRLLGLPLPQDTQTENGV